MQSASNCLPVVLRPISQIYSFFGLCREPVVRAYDGYGDADNVIVHGHVLRLSPRPRKTYRHNRWVNFFGMIRLFIVRPIPHARVMISWNGETRETFTDLGGFFRLEWKPVNPLEPGWHEAVVSYVYSEPASVELAKTTCHIYIPHKSEYCFVSDIDDTFLVSHSSNLLKRLRVLFSRNARSREAFEGVVAHYRLLSEASMVSGSPNPFFYVSSSEWNLYDYIREFCRKQNMPRGVFLLSAIKQLPDLLKTGQGKHAAKYVRIARILKSYPHHRYVLLGDNSQEDPIIYEKLVNDFPGMISAVYIRNIRPSKAGSSKAAIGRMETLGAEACFFVHSAEAVAHSRRIGLAAGDTGTRFS